MYSEKKNEVCRHETGTHLSSRIELLVERDCDSIVTFLTH